MARLNLCPLPSPFFLTICKLNGSCPDMYSTPSNALPKWYTAYSMVSLVVMLVRVVGDQLVVCDIDCESAGADEEAGEGASEAVRAGEGTGISPGLSVVESVSNSSG